jgi:hypothetical protein
MDLIPDKIGTIAVHLCPATIQDPTQEADDERDSGKLKA